MYTIRAAAAATGIPESTLRAWERRYQVVNPARSASGYRLYSESDLGDLVLMKRLMASGRAPGQAAAEVRRRQLLGLPATRPSDPAGEETAAARSDLVAVALTMDGRRIQTLLDDRFGARRFEQAAEEWMLPALGQIGDAWADGTLDVAAEHLVSEMLLQRASAAFTAVAVPEDAPGVVVGLPPGARHEIGLLTFGVAARRAGLDVAYLGADVPLESWLHAVTRLQARAAVLAVPCLADAPSAIAVARGLATAHPDVEVGVGGGHQEVVPGARHLGHDIPAAAAALARRLGAGAGTGPVS